ncbi:hypothetical protein BG58_40920 [Caballeronia jiangsuensis]|nr:hypothetical protein BG58_40920 [Caballeronia jiangsuensis]
MPDDQRGKFRSERDRCLQGVRDKPQMVQILATGRATARVEGKIYYVAGQRDGGGLDAPPLNVTKPLPVEAYAARIFPRARLEDARAATSQRVPGATIVYASGRFVIASLSPHHTASQLAQISARLEHFLSYLQDEYGIRMPDSVITVYLVPDPQAMIKLASTLHGISAPPTTLGYAFQNDLSVVCSLTGTATGTVLHELFHLAAHASFGDIPQFLDEGMARLYETSTVVDGRYYGAPNWRGKVLKAGREMGSAVPLPAVITSPWFADEPTFSAGNFPHFNMEQQAYVLAAARYFTIWLQQQHKLAALFDAMRDRPMSDQYVSADKQALQIVEKVAAKPMDQLERDFGTWLMMAERVEPGQPFPGVKTIASHTETIEKEIPREFIDREVPTQSGH